MRLQVQYVQFACVYMHTIWFVCLSVCLFVCTKIARFGNLGVIARCKCHYSYGKLGKFTFFSLLDA